MSSKYTDEAIVLMMGHFLSCLSPACTIRNKRIMKQSTHGISRGFEFDLMPNFNLYEIENILQFKVKSILITPFHTDKIAQNSGNYLHVRVEL